MMPTIRLVHHNRFTAWMIQSILMPDIQLEIVLFLIQRGFVLGKDFSMDANGDLIIGSAETFSALTEFMDSLS
jgi:hypothetical protein